MMVCTLAALVMKPEMKADTCAVQEHMCHSLSVVDGMKDTAASFYWLSQVSALWRHCSRSSRGSQRSNI